MKFISILLLPFLIGCNAYYEMQSLVYDAEAIAIQYKYDIENDYEKRRIANQINDWVDKASRVYRMSFEYPLIDFSYDKDYHKYASYRDIFDTHIIYINMNYYELENKTVKNYYKNVFFYHEVAHYIDRMVNGIKAKNKHDEEYLGVLMDLGFSYDKALFIRGDEDGEFPHILDLQLSDYYNNLR